MHHKKRLALDHFLYFGGIENRPRQFTRQDPEDLKNMDKEERDLATAVHFIDGGKKDSSKWALDFLGMAKSYFSFYLPQCRDYDEDDVEISCAMAKNLYNFLLYHNVCPEDTILQEIKAALQLVENQVRPELAAIKATDKHLPGQFNHACDVLFSKANLMEPDDSDVFHAKTIVCGGIKALGNETMIQFIQQPNWEQMVKVVSEKGCSFELIQINRGNNREGDSPTTQGSTLGSMACKPWENDCLAEYDLPKHVKKEPLELVEFWVEDQVLEHCCGGMKLLAEVRVLQLGDNGPHLWTFYSANLLCSFYLSTLNDLIGPANESFDLDSDGAGEGMNEENGKQPGDVSAENDVQLDMADWAVGDSGRVIQDLEDFM